MTIDVPSSADERIVPMALQSLLENAVKHNMVTSNKPLHIKIYEDNGALVVENNLQPKQIVKKSSGVGLSNIKQRYDLLTDKRVYINQGAGRFAVAIPIVSIPEEQKRFTVTPGISTESNPINEIKRAIFNP